MNAVTQQEQTALTLPERATVALGEAANIAKLRDLVAQSANIIAVTNSDGRDEAHRAGMVLRTARTSITNAGKAAREDATAFSKAVIAMEKELIKIVEPEEERVLSLRDRFDAQLAAEKAAKVAAERERTAAIEARIATIALLPATHAQSDSATLAEVITEHDGWTPAPELFEEYADKALEAVAGALVTLRDMLTARQQVEAAALAAEQSRIAEAARLEAERAENARVAADNARQAAEVAAERKRLADVAEAQQAAADAAQREAEAKAKAVQAEQDRIAAEQKAAFDKQVAELAEQQRALKVRQDEADARDAAAQKAVRDAIDREADHGPALEMNAEFDAARAQAAASEAERQRLQVMTEQAQDDEHEPMPSLDALMDDVSHVIYSGEVEEEFRACIRTLLSMDFTPPEIRDIVESELCG